jgi:hypothetical protein
MLSGDAAEGEDSSEREVGQPTLSQPSGTPPIQPSGTQSPFTQSSGEQSPSCLSEGAMASPSPASAPMPFFTGRNPGTGRLLPPRKSKAISVVTMSSNEETTLETQTTTTQVEGSERPKIVENTAKQQARIKDIVERQRNGTWDGVPHGMHILVGIDGHERL